MDGHIRTASAEYDRLCDLGDRLDAATEYELAELLADEGSVEEAIGANADMFRTLLVELTAHPDRGADIARRMWAAVRSDLEPVAIREAQRSMMWEGA